MTLLRLLLLALLLCAACVEPERASEREPSPEAWADLQHTFYSAWSE